MSKQIKFLDLSTHYKKHQKNIDRDLKKILTKGLFLNGEYLAKFEHNFAKYCNSKYCIGMANGLDALTIALKTLNIKPGDEVIVPAHTFIATWLAVSNVGAIPIAVDIEEDSYNINPDLIDKKITKKTKAIIGVHLYGLPCNAERINKICKKHKLFFIEDAAQAHGALFKSKKVGSLSDIACFSFYPGKNLGAAGDGGAFITNNKKYANTARKIANYGSETKYHHDILGVNSRLDEIHAAILNEKLQEQTQLAQGLNDQLQC